jgi:NAD(P)-dependent dehydrogenase (short-subunit alcohol dehydrogenase family)
MTLSSHSSNLHGTVAVVTGASRGGGRAIALALGEAGATVYVTGRSTRASGTTDRTPGTIDETAEEVTVRSGNGISVKVDHTDETQVAVLFDQIKEQQRGQLDLLVNNAWGGCEQWSGDGFVAPFWEQPLSRWEGMFVAGLRAHFVASRFAAPLMIAQRRGLIVNTVA